MASADPPSADALTGNVDSKVLLTTCNAPIPCRYQHSSDFLFRYLSLQKQLESIKGPLTPQA